MTDSTAPAIDPYEPKPSLWQRNPHLGWGLAVFAATTVLTYVMFPPAATGDAAYVFALPAILWAYRTPAFKPYAWSVLGAQAVAWTCLLGWLHNVTWLGLFLLGPFVGLLNGLWFLGVWWAVPRLRGHQALVRILAMLGLAALWVVIEWVRSQLFGGFPWLPLAASQWQRPFVLQMAAYAGSWAISFVLVTFNLGAAAYAHRIFFEGATGLRKRSPEFTIGLLVLMGATFPFMGDFLNQQRHRVMSAALVQPYIPQGEKWDSARALDILKTIEKTTFDANSAGAPDVIVWPEAVTPWALNRDPAVADWLESIAKRTGKPLLLGTVYTEVLGHPDEQWYNGAFVVTPREGVQRPGYAKRKLVPFGEYVPLRPIFGWLEKFVPIGGDFQRGDSVQPLELRVNTTTVSVGPLICYEDIFPQLARESTLAGAEVLAVLTNNGWFGEGGAAYQHAAHSVLRAVENRRPVVRCGNGGWSGWIDEFGNVRDMLRNENGSVYFRGAKTVAVTRDLRWRGRLSFYTQSGDWFVPVCAVAATGAYFLMLLLRVPRPRGEGDAAF